MVLFSYKRVEKEKEQINKINVFPVPDQDTGNNMAKTLLGIKEAIEGREFKDLKEISDSILEGALNAAQGNAGVIYTGFLAGFLPLLEKNGADVKNLAAALEKGAERAKNSIQNPRDGTILDVVEATVLAFKKNSGEEDIIVVLKSAIEKANEALLATREKMEIFKKANVVDAGGLGFLIILESYLEALEGEKEEKKKEEMPSEKIRRFVQVLSNRYEIVALIENPRLEEKTIKEKLKRWGNSLDVVQIGERIKLHIHTDYPDEVKSVIREAGKIQTLRVEDMAQEVVGEESVRKTSIGVVTDDVSMLLPKIIEKYQIGLVYLKYGWPELENLPGQNIYQKMRGAEKKAIKTLPKTAQATPRDYFFAFEKQLKNFEKVLCITVSSKISGCYNSAIKGQEMTESPERVFILDSLNAGPGEALLVLRALELIQEQREIEEIMKELRKEITKIRLYAIIEDPKWAANIGRITKSQADWIRRMQKLKINPIIKFKNGVLTKGGVVFAEDAAEAIFKKILKESKKARKNGKKIRVVIGHADNIPQAEKLKKMLKAKIQVEIPYISMGPEIISVGAGPGTLLAGWSPLENYNNFLNG